MTIFKSNAKILYDSIGEMLDSKCDRIIVLFKRIYNSEHLSYKTSEYESIRHSWASSVSQEMYLCYNRRDLIAAKALCHFTGIPVLSSEPNDNRNLNIRFGLAVSACLYTKVQSIDFITDDVLKEHEQNVIRLLDGKSYYPLIPVLASFVDAIKQN